MTLFLLGLITQHIIQKKELFLCRFLNALCPAELYDLMFKMMLQKTNEHNISINFVFMCIYANLEQKQFITHALECTFSYNTSR